MRPAPTLVALAALVVLPLSAPALVPAGGGLEAGLASVRTESLSADLHFLADDALAGRDTPSEGLRFAARFIRARLQRLGFEPGAGESYFHVYHLERKPLDLERTHAVVVRGDDERRLAWGADMWVHPRRFDEGESRGPVVFCGEGSEADFAELDLAGKWAFCHDVRLPWYARMRSARDAGALGVLVARPADYPGRSYAEEYASWRDEAGGGRLGLPGDGGRPSFAYTRLSPDAAAALLGDAKPAVGDDLGVTYAEARVAVEPERFEVENVCGFWPGSDPELAKEVLIVSAHYDHVGTSDEGIFNGADDNGSGTTGLLGLAEALAAYGPMRRSVLLIWVSGEEKGLLGSRAWARAPTLPEGHRAVANLNIDMIGRNAPDKLRITPSAEHEEYNGLTRVAERFAPLEGFPALPSADEYWSRSDHASFSEELDIPVAFLFADIHDDYHRPTDTAEKIDYDKIRRVTRLVLRMLDGLQTDELEL